MPRESMYVCVCLCVFLFMFFPLQSWVCLTLFCCLFYIYLFVLWLSRIMPISATFRMLSDALIVFCFVFSSVLFENHWSCLGFQSRENRPTEKKRVLSKLRVFILLWWSIYLYVKRFWDKCSVLFFNYYSLSLAKPVFRDPRRLIQAPALQKSRFWWMTVPIYPPFLTFLTTKETTPIAILTPLKASSHNDTSESLLLLRRPDWLLIGSPSCHSFTRRAVWVCHYYFFLVLCFFAAALRCYYCCCSCPRPMFCPPM